MHVTHSTAQHSQAHTIEMMIYEYLSGTSKLHMKSDSNISVALQDRLPANRAAHIFIESVI